MLCYSWSSFKDDQFQRRSPNILKKRHTFSSHNCFPGLLTNNFHGCFQAFWVWLDLKKPSQEALAFQVEQDIAVFLGEHWDVWCGNVCKQFINIGLHDVPCGMWIIASLFSPYLYFRCQSICRNSINFDRVVWFVSKSQRILPSGHIWREHKVSVSRIERDKFQGS